MVVTVVFHIRITRNPTTKSLSISNPWQKLIWVLYLTSLLIMVRSVFRMIEYAEGNDGELLKKEIYIYLLDATLMVIVAGVFTVHHPSGVLREYAVLDGGIETGGSPDNYPMIKGARLPGRL